jgi:hypothetical protein
VLLGLTTHSDKRVRNAAIVTVKKWVPDVKELSETIVKFAVSLLDRLKVPPPKKEEDEDAEKKPELDGAAAADDEGEADMAMEATPPPQAPKPPYALVKGGEVVDRLDPASTTQEVVQHVELLLALCVKEPSLLRPYVPLSFPFSTLLKPFFSRQNLRAIPASPAFRPGSPRRAHPAPHARPRHQARRSARCHRRLS